MAICIFACFAFCISPSARAADAPELWVYSGVNFQVNDSVDKLIALLERAKKAGYNAAVITDYKFGRIDDRPQHYYTNMKRTRDAAQRIGIELIPCVMPIGYSGAILQNDPNLAAGLPVKDCAFVVRDGKATPADMTNLLPGGAFETAQKNKPADWDWIDAFGKLSSLDTNVKHSGKSSLHMSNFRAESEHGNGRVVRNLTLKPWHQYRLSLWVKTKDMENISEFKAALLTDAGRSLNHASFNTKRTQDWTQHTIAFNSLEHETARLYLGIWGGSKGELWIDDVTLTIAGGVNLLRREGCPLKVTNRDGSITYEEGRDFEKWQDAKLGRVPYAGEFDDDHAAPPLVLTKNSRIKDGDELRVSFYHTVIVHDGQVSCALIADDLFKHLHRQIELIDKHFAPRRYFMQHDEFRVGGFDAQEQAAGKTSGQLMAMNAQRCVKVIREVNPKAGIVVWSDMFDPHHNARANYYLVANTLEGAWEGLDKNVGIVNWNGGKKADSLKFFADRGHEQFIAGYYDTGDVAGHTQGWMKATANVSGVKGYMYTTWQQNYTGLEKFAETVRGH
ncbi:MAG: hypothetical protein WD768_19845 [Phycisphaeraceae bacterium]